MKRHPMMNELKAITAAAILLAGGVATVARADDEPVTAAARLEAHVRFLADDLLEGRDNGTAGYEIAARYVEAQFRSTGLKPAYNGEWYQQVPMVVRGSKIDVPATLTLNGITESPIDASVYVRTEAPINWTGGIIFAGLTPGSADPDMDSLAALNVRGKLVAVFPLPASDFVQAGKREEILMKMGAAGLIELPSPTAGTQISGIRGQLEPVGVELEDNASENRLPIFARVGSKSADHMFQGSRLSYPTLIAKARNGDRLESFELKATAGVSGARGWQRPSSPNVLGYVEGGDAKLRDEVVVVTAHLDHIGVDPTITEGDRINNGALDNATGVSIMIELARAISAGKKPRRSILFAAVTSEEDGLLGSRYLASHFPSKIGKPVAVVNIDMPVLTYDFSDIVAVGEGESTLGQTIRRASLQSGVAIVEPQKTKAFFQASDQYSFVKRGVPGIFVLPGPGRGGDEILGEFMHSNYHQPSDDARQPILWGAAAKFLSANVAILKSIADSPNAPMWYDDSRFGQNYAPDAKKATRSEHIVLKR